jgi:hypothetical protein
MVLVRKVSSADSTPVASPFSIRKLYWKGPVTIGDTVVLQDSAANEIITLVCEVASQSQVVEFPNEGFRISAAGHKVSTIASGTLYIYGA